MLVFEPRHTAMFLSLSIGCNYKPYYETHEFLLSFVLFYYAISLIAILMIVLLTVRGMMLVHSYRVRYIPLRTYKIRFEAPKRQRGRVVESEKMVLAKLIYNNICVVPDMIITAIYYN